MSELLYLANTIRKQYDAMFSTFVEHFDAHEWRDLVSVSNWVTDVHFSSEGELGVTMVAKINFNRGEDITVTNPPLGQTTITAIRDNEVVDLLALEHIEKTAEGLTKALTHITAAIFHAVSKKAGK